MNEQVAWDSILPEVLSKIPQGNWTATRLSGGIESIVMRLDQAHLPSYVVKIAPHRGTENANDPDLDFFDLYMQEQWISTWCISQGFPACNVEEIFLSSNGLPVMLMPFIANDGSELDGISLGDLTKQLHSLPAPAKLTVAMRGQAWGDAAASLIMKRLEIISCHFDQQLIWPTLGQLQAAFDSLSDKRSLLHMDLRAANVLCNDGHPVRVIDWANTVIGHPLLELARISEYDLLTPEFSQGYGNPGLVSALTTKEGIACRIYTAAMMVVLFAKEIPDEQQALHRLLRLESLLKEFSA